MNVLEAAQSHGLAPKKASAAKNEWHSACPGCGDGGKGTASDRFHIWPDQNDGEGSYWCRQCNKGGDLLQFFMDFEGKSFDEACAAAGRQSRVPSRLALPKKPAPTSTFVAETCPDPENLWQEKAAKLVKRAHQVLLSNVEQMGWLAERGIGLETVRLFNMGWNPGENGKDLFRPRVAWGLPEEFKSDGKAKMLWIPRGLVVPYTAGGTVLRVRIRRPDEFMRPEDKNRYYVLPGSAMHRTVIGENCRVYIIVETELDGYLLYQELAAYGIGVVALGTSHAKPDAAAMKHLEGADWILNSLDYDKAGATGSRWWRDQFGSKVRRWPVPCEKDPGDAYRYGVDLVSWAIGGLPSAWIMDGVALEGSVEGGAASDMYDDESESDAAEPEFAAGVYELAELLKKHPVMIEKNHQRKRIVEARAWAGRNPDVSRKISNLVFFDEDVVAFVAEHPAERINGVNILKTQ